MEPGEVEPLELEEVDTMMQDISNSLNNTPNRLPKGEASAEGKENGSGSMGEIINSPKKTLLDDSLSAEAVTPVQVAGACLLYTSPSPRDS